MLSVSCFDQVKKTVNSTKTILFLLKYLGLLNKMIYTQIGYFKTWYFFLSLIKTKI